MAPTLSAPFFFSDSRGTRRFLACLGAEHDVDDFRRHAETGRNDAGAETARYDQMTIVLDHVTIGETRAVFRRHESRPDQRQADLATVGMAGKRQRNAGRYARKNV